MAGLRRRLRCVAWVQWKTRGQRYRELRRLSERSASAAVFSSKGRWRLSFSAALHRAFTNARFRRLGLLFMETARRRLIRRTGVVRTRMPGGVGGLAPRGVLLSRSSARKRRGPRTEAAELLSIKTAFLAELRECGTYARKEILTNSLDDYSRISQVARFGARATGASPPPRGRLAPRAGRIRSAFWYG
jgi:hypothetical protein